MESAKKSLKEASNPSYTLEDLERLLKIDEETNYELDLIPSPKNEDVPFAWDASISIVEGQVHIDGYFQPGGPESGKVHIECPFRTFQRCCSIHGDLSHLDELDISEEDKELVRTVCTSY